MWRYYNKFDSTKPLRVRYRCVKIPQRGYMEHGLKDIAFYVQKHITPCHNFPAGSRQAARGGRIYCLSIPYLEGSGGIQGDPLLSWCKRYIDNQLGRRCPRRPGWLSIYLLHQDRLSVFDYAYWVLFRHFPWLECYFPVCGYFKWHRKTFLLFGSWTIGYKFLYRSQVNNHMIITENISQIFTNDAP